MKLARAMLFGKDLPKFLWAKAVRHAAYIRNRSPTQALADKMPEEAWTGRKPNISHLREFGTGVWILNEGNQYKLNPKSTKHTFLVTKTGQRLSVTTTQVLENLTPSAIANSKTRGTRRAHCRHRFLALSLLGFHHGAKKVVDT